MKKTLTISFLFIILLFAMTTIVNSNYTNSVNMDVYIDSTGNAHITEIWNGNYSKNTEIYHSYKNIGKSTFKDFSVSENGNNYTNIGKWNIDASFSSKAYKCGINKISDGVELCWGISQYGTHTYIAKYTITNFVSNLTDSQMVYWELLPPASDTIKNAYIKIHSDFNYSNDTPVWGFGNYGGTCYVYDGYIEMSSDGKLGSNEYLTILVKFPLNTFQSNNYLNNNFDYYLDMATESSTVYKENNFGDIFFFVTMSVVLLLSVIVAILIMKPSSKLSFGTAR